MIALARRAAVLALFVGAVGCKPKSPIAPERAHRLQPSSAVMADADLVVRALMQDDLQLLRQWMTPELRSRVDVNMLEEAGAHMRKAFGMPRGVLEERTHREGELNWYSGLWVHESQRKNRVLTPVLYQFALDDQHRLARLLVREHWFIENLDPPADYYQPVTRLHFIGKGEWTVSHGGRGRSVNHHYGTRLQRFAYDIVVKQNGRRRRPGSNPGSNDAYYCYGKQLLAPAAGTVIVAVNDVPDNRPGQRGEKGGNGLVIDHGFGEYSALWHAIRGSVRVKVGDRVEVGQVVALAGNSGHSSGPHVHFHVQTRGRKGGDLGLPAPFVEVWVDDVWREAVEPRRGETVRLDRPGSTGIARGPRVFVDL